MPETTTTYFCNLPDDSSIDTPITLPATNQKHIYSVPPHKKVKQSHISSNQTQSYPDLSMSEESDQESGNWSLTGLTKHVNSRPVIGLGFHRPSRSDSVHSNGDLIFKKLQVGNWV